MKTLYVHMGTPKTGTTTLQKFFECNKEILENKGIYYPLWNDWEHWGGQKQTRVILDGW